MVVGFFFQDGVPVESTTVTRRKEEFGIIPVCANTFYYSDYLDNLDLMSAG